MNMNAKGDSVMLTEDLGSTVVVEVFVPSSNSVWCHMGPHLDMGWLLWLSAPTLRCRTTTGNTRALTEDANLLLTMSNFLNISHTHHIWLCCELLCLQAFDCHPLHWQLCSFVILNAVVLLVVHIPRHAKVCNFYCEGFIQPWREKLVK